MKETKAIRHQATVPAVQRQGFAPFFTFPFFFVTIRQHMLGSDSLFLPPFSFSLLSWERSEEDGPVARAVVEILLSLSFASWRNTLRPFSFLFFSLPPLLIAEDKAEERAAAQRDTVPCRSGSPFSHVPLRPKSVVHEDLYNTFLPCPKG